MNTYRHLAPAVRELFVLFVTDRTVFLLPHEPWGLVLEYTDYCRMYTYRHFAPAVRELLILLVGDCTVFLLTHDQIYVKIKSIPVNIADTSKYFVLRDWCNTIKH